MFLIIFYLGVTGSEISSKKSRVKRDIIIQKLIFNIKITSVIFFFRHFANLHAKGRIICVKIVSPMN